MAMELDTLYKKTIISQVMPELQDRVREITKGHRMENALTSMLDKLAQLLNQSPVSSVHCRVAIDRLTDIRGRTRRTGRGRRGRRNRWILTTVELREVVL